MTELRLNLRWQGCPDTLNLFGDFAEAGGVAVGVAAAFFVGDDGEAFAEDAATSVNGVHRKSLKREALWRRHQHPVSVNEYADIRESRISLLGNRTTHNVRDRCIRNRDDRKSYD